MAVKNWNTGASAERYRENERASERKVDKQMVNLHSRWIITITWIADILVDLTNDDNPKALLNLRKK